MAHLTRQQKSGPTNLCFHSTLFTKMPIQHHEMAKVPPPKAQETGRSDWSIGSSSVRTLGAKWDHLRRQSDRDRSLFADAPRPLKLQPEWRRAESPFSFLLYKTSCLHA